MNGLKKYLTPVNLLYIAWIITISGILGSLVYSEILQLPPCILCWYQRILLYPLAVIFLIGLYFKDRHLPYYVLPFSILGLSLAFYQILLQKGILPESPSTCQFGVSCAEETFKLFGFLSIPMQSFGAFVLITVLVLYSLKLKKVSS